MPKILVYNNDINRMVTFNRDLNQPMPYNSRGTLTVREFKGGSNSNTLWTDLRCMEAWNSFRYIYGRGIFVGFAFKRPWEGGHSRLSQHYAGLAYDVGQNLNQTERASMRELASTSGIWNYVEPVSLTPRWVHFDERQVPAGYPVVRQGVRGVYVCVLQDCLNTLGFRTGGLDGVFGNQTNNAVRSYQQNRGLTVDGIVGPNTWNRIMGEAVGNGSTSTTIN